MTAESTYESSAWVGLKGTSFDVRRQMDLLKINFEEYFSGRTEFEQMVEISKQEILEDLRSWYSEFVAGLCVLPFELRRTFGPDGPRIVCPLYGDKVWLDTISFQERDGVTKTTAAKIAEFISFAPEGCMAFFTSPDGWNGLSDADGNPYEDYLSSQTWIYKVCEGGKIEATTIVTSMTLDQNEQLLRLFGLDQTGGEIPNRQRIKNVVARPVFLSSGWQVRDIVEKIELIMGSGVACKYIDQKSGKVKRQTSFDGIYSQLQQREEISRIDHGEIIDLLAEFEISLEGVLKSPEQKESIVRVELMLSKLILDISAASRGVTRQERQTADFYDQEYQRVKDYDGPCPKGGNVIYQNGFGPRLIKIKNWEYKPGYCVECESHKSDVGPCGICKKCEEKFDRQEVWAQLQQIV